LHFHFCGVVTDKDWKTISIFGTHWWMIMKVGATHSQLIPLFQLSPNPLIYCNWVCGWC
jgi:hypothetical protein